MLNKQSFLLIVLAIILVGIYLASKQQTPTNQSLPQAESQLTTPECNLTPTPPQAEGPYYKSGSPQRTNTAKDVTGEKLIVTGVVFDKNCKPKSYAWLDFWQAGADGQYDNTGYKLRGHQYADKDGKYTLETVIPAPYSTRPPHIHVKVRSADGPTLTTQLYFPNAPISKELILNIKEVDDVKQATFNFVL